MNIDIQKIQDDLEKIEENFKAELQTIEERLKETKKDMYLLEIDSLLNKKKLIGRNSVEALELAYKQLWKAKMDIDSKIEDLQKFHDFFKTERAEKSRNPYEYIEY